MKTTTAVLVGILLGSLSLVCFAQEEESAPERFIYATYFQCPGGPLARADELIAEDEGRMDQLVEDGTILGWGWLGHHTGGPWNRIFYYQAASMHALLDGGDAVQDTGDDDDDDDGLTFRQVCNQHDDYIWQAENGTLAQGTDRGAAGFSVYHVCDINREERADELVDEHVAPILNQYVEDGKLTSWGWSSHVVGGEYRRLQTMTATDHKALLSARADAIEAIYEEDNEAGAELSEICGPHVDYMWNIIHETP